MAVVRFRITWNTNVVHELQVKSLDDKSVVLGKEVPVNRTVIVVNVPLYLQEDDVKSLFLRFGPVSTVSFPKSLLKNNFPVKCGCKLAYVTFDSAECAREVFRQNDDGRAVSLSRPSGLEKWRQHYLSLVQEPEMTLTEAHEVIEQFKAVSKSNKLRKAATAEPDEDGWITVTRDQKRKVIRKSKSYVEKLNAKELSKKKKESRCNETPFYRFQIRDSKRKQIEELQRKFEEDKKRIKLMMESRKFKPF
ncbi:RRM 6 and RRP7 domain containing protein [Trichuris trichiura]|uniref:RRM 6 and RRP7 domain containing protein n=1 Tax=Trichuris trichiura TaxID=36087 RepID=A0A077Z4I1_TRITR|nr:RRM 6 and RRP7 domain containing protein [Trichuris trichiura]